MFVIDPAALARHAVLKYLQGEPTNSIAEMVAAEKIVDLDAARARLRPTVPAHVTAQ
jgi:hypothetical protein